MNDIRCTSEAWLEDRHRQTRVCVVRATNRPAAAAAAAEDDGETGKMAVIAGRCCRRDRQMPHNDFVTIRTPPVIYPGDGAYPSSGMGKVKQSI